MRPPLLVQRRVHGHDVRVHFVGMEAVAIALKTDAVDYRYAEKQGYILDAVECTIPPETKALCIGYMTIERIEFAAFDFILEDGQWILLEMNPMPGYSWFDKFCAGRISQLLWSSLVRGYSNLSKTDVSEKPWIGRDRRPVLDQG